ncbi:hypothetical protein H8356DRAFT_953136 [Neocallimastix lanati (nom. inval.)]|uniref:Uncharacterized protein n=1 Tax=Neocallimastix californiae TaxID=1754190 RepID=A0A1Y2ALB6_9FUNG|nr:hypothetical protein H8356DRAFT_953136 [Neocallimastix sp. JGI-2020a]ORY23017.1 hypothetical protein LY90DRAFT_515210 [Neocallimastix californiae]|eukprot:ORY23017.1 hypothetical protein LY90DRAFT_515210 [Neocallimastix californiae]
MTYYSNDENLVLNKYPNYSTDSNIDNFQDSTSSSSLSLSSSSSYHQKIFSKLEIENNQEKINQYISETFQKKFISYLFDNSEILSNLINNKDLKYINSLDIKNYLKNKSNSNNEMMIKLVKYKIETYRNNSNQLNQNWNIDDIELNINANHYKKVLLDYKNPKITENIILSYIWPKHQKLQNDCHCNNVTDFENPNDLINHWNNFNYCIHQYFWYNDIVKKL